MKRYFKEIHLNWADEVLSGTLLNIALDIGQYDGHIHKFIVDTVIAKLER